MSAPLLSAAATVCGAPDPAVVADRLFALPADQVAACSHHAGALAVALFQGSHAAQDAATMTGGAWSTGTGAVTAIGQTGMAAMAARSVLTTLSGALDGAQATMRQLQTLARAAIADAEVALRQAGFDASTGKASTAPVTQLPFPLSSPTGTSVDGTKGVVAPIVAMADERLRALEARLDTALHELVPATRVDPRDLLQRLPPLPKTAPSGSVDVAKAGGFVTDAVAATVGALGAVVGGLLAGGAAGASARSGQAVAAAVRSAAATAAGAASDRVAAVGDALAGSVTEVSATASQADADARARLQRDLQSDDEATRQLATGVATAIADAEASGQTVQLLTYTSATATTQGTAAIGLGDLATADSVTTVVPGVMNHPAAMSGALGDAARLQAEAHRRSPGTSSAVVAWFGYDIPMSMVSGAESDPVTDATSALDDAAAVSGGRALAADLARFRAYAPETARQVAIGHSMGSVVVSAAAAQGATIDDLVLVGSPGASRLADSMNDYPNVAPGHTWVIALDDPVTEPEADFAAGALRGVIDSPRLMSPSTAPSYLGDRLSDMVVPPHGHDPAAADFGAAVVDAVGGRPAWRDFQDKSYPFTLSSPRLGEWMYNLGNHPMDNYFSATSLTAMADITAGHTADVPTKPGRS